MEPNEFADGLEVFIEERDKAKKAEEKLQENKRFPLSVVVGKFYPFHSGHKYLIEQAGERSDHVVILVCYKDTHTIPGFLRASWVKGSFPSDKFEVILVDQDVEGLPDDNSLLWANYTMRTLGRKVDAVFSSEDYGYEYARLMGAKHIMVDKERLIVPTSGTKIRLDPLGNQEYLTPRVRAHFVMRVCVLGAESTGKTTLSRNLAERYKTLWAPEYGHVYNAFRPEGIKGWQSREFTLISKTQSWLEDFLSGYANKILFCDTDAFVTAVFHQEYMGSDSEILQTLARERRPYDLYILTDINTPFAQDVFNLRVDGEHRKRMNDIYKQHIIDSGVPFIEVSGSIPERLEQATQAIEAILASNPERIPLSPARAQPRGNDFDKMLIDLSLSEGL